MKEERSFIPGIFNWCDRWCQRCGQTDKCRVFSQEEEQKRNEPEKDWPEVLEDNFSETLQMLKKVAEELGFTLDTSREEAESILAVEEAQAILIHNHPLTVLAESYWKKGKAWIDSDLLMEKLENWKLLFDSKVMDAKEFESNLKLVEEAMSVVEWYLFFIPGKIKRSLHDQVDDFWDQFPDEERSDLGSAKIAAIAVERSKGAWGIFLSFFPSDPQVKEILDVLDNILRGIIEVFPNYSKFIRPGFEY